MASGKASEMEQILEILKEEKIDVRECLTVLARGKASEIKEIIKVLKEEKIDVRECLGIIAYGKANEIEKIIKILKREKIDVRKCLSVLARNKASEIEEIIKTLKKEKIDVRECLGVLAWGKVNKIEEILEILKREDIDVRECLSVLVRNKAGEIEKIIKILKREKIDVRKCLTILAFGKVSEIEEIIKILKREKIDVQKCLSVLAYGKASEIEKIIKLLKEEDIDMKYLSNNVSLYRIFLLNNAETIKNLFDDNYEFKDKKEYLNNLKLYLILKQEYNKFYSFDEIDYFCEQRHIDIEIFFNLISLYNDTVNEMIEFYKKNNDKKVWIGKSYPMNKCQLEKYKFLIIDIAKHVANYCKVLYKTDKSDLEDEAVYILMNKTGNIFNNFEFNEVIMKKCLFKYCRKNLQMFIRSNYSVRFLEDYDRQFGEFDNYIDDDIEEMDFYTDDKFDDYELRFLKRLNELLSCGYSMDSLMEEFNLNPTEYNNILQNIQQKILRK